LVLSFSPLKVEIVGTLGVRAVFYLIPSLLFLIIDSVVPSLAVSIKKQGESALPTRSAQGRRKARGRTPWYQVVGLSIFNIVLGVGIQASVEFLLTEVFNVRSALQVTTTLPMPWTIAKGVGRGLLLREVGIPTGLIHRSTNTQKGLPILYPSLPTSSCLSERHK
jgi:hypothetical protein